MQPLGVLINFAAVLLSLAKPSTSASAHHEYPKGHADRRNWNNVDNTTLTMISDPSTMTTDKFAYASCSYSDLEEETIPCHLHLESPRFDKPKIYDCDTGLHPSEIGHVPRPVHPFIFYLLGEKRIIFPWIDRKSSKTILVLRIVDMASCETRDLHVKVAEMPIFKVMTYANGFDVFYGRPHGKVDPMHQIYYRESYDLDGNEARETITIFEDIEQDELKRSVNMVSSPLDQLYPIYNGDSGGYFFISKEQVKILGPGGKVIASKKLQIGDLFDRNLIYGNNSLYIIESDECILQVLQIDEHLNLARNITYEFDEERTFAMIFVNYPEAFLVLTSDLAEPYSEKTYYLETIDVEGRRGKPMAVGKLRFQENPLAFFYSTYSENHVCINVLSFSKLTIGGLKTTCVPKADLGN